MLIDVFIYDLRVWFGKSVLKILYDIFKKFGLRFSNKSPYLQARNKLNFGFQLFIKSGLALAIIVIGESNIIWIVAYFIHNICLFLDVLDPAQSVDEDGVGVNPKASVFV